MSRLMGHPRVAGAAVMLALTGGCEPSRTEAPPFQPLEQGPLVEYRASSRGAAWGDFDGDGDPDLFVARPDPGQQSGLYQNDGGTLTPLPLPPSGRATAGSESAAWIDVDGDGDLDLHVVGRIGRGSTFYENHGEGRLTARATDPFEGLVSSASMTCWADADGDGWLDAFVIGYRSDSNRLFRNVGAWQMRPVDLPRQGQGDGAARACAWADLDGDRLPEMVVANASVPNVLLRNRGDMVFVIDTTTALSTDLAYAYGLSVVDVNEDGRRDIFVANFDGPNTLLLGRPDGGLEPVALGESLQSAASKGHAWGDYDLDGHLDLYLGSGTPAVDMVNRLYLGVGDGRYTLSTEGVYATHADTSAAVAAADYDLDGDLDLFVANWGSPASVDRLYVNSTRGRHWLQVALEGVRSNRMGVGARVSVFVSWPDGGRWMHRWLDTSTGYAGQNEPVLHFGLGSAPRVDSLVVAWPSGLTDRQARVDADQRVVVREGG